MKFKDKYFHCGDFLQNSLKTEIEEISQCISNMKWKPDFGGVFLGLDYSQLCSEFCFVASLPRPIPQTPPLIFKIIPRPPFV